MYRATISIVGKSPLSQSRLHRLPFLEGESHEAYEERTWREKTNHDKEGNVFIPAFAFKQAFDSAAKWLALKDPDNKRAMLTKFFVSSIIIEESVPIGVTMDKIPRIVINANSDGVRGSGKRVQRIFPQTQNWKGVIKVMVLEEKIRPENLKKVAEFAGMAIGVGQFRPQNGGINGRWTITGFETEKI